jgi:type IV secretion system protein VirD4
MQLPPDDEIVMVAGVPPIRAKKARYFEDPRLTKRILLPPKPDAEMPGPKPDDWSTLAATKPIAPIKTNNVAAEQIEPSVFNTSPDGNVDSDPANAGLRREPGLERHKDIAPEPANRPINEFEPDRDENDDDAVRRRVVTRSMRQIARQAAMDPHDGVEL